jgi:glucose-6-phosphate dehydrogenase assembly protein OpcA
MTAEEERTRLIGDIARVLKEGPVPDDTRAAALALIGWLARRMPGEPVSHCDTARCKRIDAAVVPPANEPVPSALPEHALESEAPRSERKRRGFDAAASVSSASFDATVVVERRPRTAR